MPIHLSVTEIAPFGSQIVPIAVGPRPVVGHKIGKDEERSGVSFSFNQVRGEVVAEAVRLTSWVPMSFASRK